MKRRKPTFRSVTTTPCKCRYLERMAADPDEPIVYDEEMREYHITKLGGGYLMIYHCPWCGGAAPATRRGERFATITSAEADRLEELTAKLKTVRDVLKAFGKPDWDIPGGLRVHSPAKGKKPPTRQELQDAHLQGAFAHCRCLRRGLWRPGNSLHLPRQIPRQAHASSCSGEPIGAASRACAGGRPTSGCS